MFCHNTKIWAHCVRVGCMRACSVKLSNSVRASTIYTNEETHVWTINSLVTTSNKCDKVQLSLDQTYVTKYSFPLIKHM